MEEKKKRMDPWVPAVIIGVLAILFSFYGLQLQSDLQDARKEIERLKVQTVECERRAEEQQQRAAKAMELAIIEAERARQAAEELRKSGRSK